MKLTGRANEGRKIPQMSIENNLLLTQPFIWEFPPYTIKILFTDTLVLVRLQNHESTAKEYRESQA